MAGPTPSHTTNDDQEDPELRKSPYHPAWGSRTDREGIVDLGESDKRVHCRHNIPPWVSENPRDPWDGADEGMASNSHELREAPQEIFEEGGWCQDDMPAPRGSISRVICGTSPKSKPEESTSSPEDKWWNEPGAFGEVTRREPVRIPDVSSGDTRRPLKNLDAVKQLCRAAMEHTRRRPKRGRMGVKSSSDDGRASVQEFHMFHRWPEPPEEDTDDFHSPIYCVGHAGHDQ